MPTDFKKERKDLYQPQNHSIHHRHAGDGFATRTQAQNMQPPSKRCTVCHTVSKCLEYVVPPLEGFWNVDDDTFRGAGAAITDKSKFSWTALIRQPDFITDEIFETAKKKPNLDTSKTRLVKITEGLCVQVMHIGSYDDEPATIAMMDKYAVDNGYTIDINDTRRHHEIYLSAPRKVATDKLKTVIRHPVRRV